MSASAFIKKLEYATVSKQKRGDEKVGREGIEKVGDDER